MSSSTLQEMMIDAPSTVRSVLAQCQEQAGVEHHFFAASQSAEQVQRRLLRRNPMRLRTLQGAAMYAPAGAIGGDYCDFLDLGAGSLGIVLGDVAGKGTAAALIMSSLQGWMRCECARGLDDLLAMLYRLNAHLLESTLPEHYATLFVGAYDDNTRRLDYVNCGQQTALILRADGSVDRIDTSALPVGLLPNWMGEMRSLTLQPGDTLCLASDGVAEAGIRDGLEFGEQGLIEILERNQNKDLDDVVTLVAHSARLHVIGHPADDMTVLAARVL